MCLAVPGEVKDVRGEGLARSARVSFAGVTREVSLACLPEARIGDYVLVHAGCAIARIDPQAARRTLQDLAALDA